MDKKMIADNKIIFSQLCPEPFAEAAHEKFFSGRDKCVATFTYPKVGSQELDVLGRSEEFKLSLGRTEENSRKFYCSVREASFLDARGFGYIVRLTEIIDTQNMPYEVSCFTRNPSMRPKSYFTYEPNDSKFVVVPNSYTGPEHGTPFSDHS
ncbi:MAG: hypothetical protein P4M11_15610 [Candidatus Pacebacteria bacterium]|nr:hypothetical protein [Candidatus Paceibacterota bacterium]